LEPEPEAEPEVAGSEVTGLVADGVVEGAVVGGVLNTAVELLVLDGEADADLEPVLLPEVVLEPDALLELVLRQLVVPWPTATGAEFSLRPVLSLIVNRTMSPPGVVASQVMEVFVKPWNEMTGVVGSTVWSRTLTM